MSLLIVAALVLWRYTDPEIGGAPQVSNSTGDLLKVSIALWGIAISFIVTYLAYRGGELCASITNNAVNMLADAGIAPEECHHALIFRQSPRSLWFPVSALTFICPILTSADSFERGRRHTNSQVRWMFPDQRRQSQFRFFEARKERAILWATGTVVSIAVALLVAEFVLYLLGINFSFQTAAAIVIASVSIWSSFWIYGLLILFVRRKSRLVHHFAYVLQIHLQDIKNEISRVKAEATAMDAADAARLAKEIEVFEMRLIRSATHNGV